MLVGRKEIKPGGSGAIGGVQPDVSASICRYEEDGMEGLNDRRLTRASHRRAPVDEVKLTERYRKSYRGWNVNIFILGISGMAGSGLYVGEEYASATG